MPELADRLDYEESISTRIATTMAVARNNAERGRPVNWERLEAEIREALEDELVAVFLLIFLFMADEDLQNRREVAESASRELVGKNAGQLASELANNQRRELAGGREPEVVFSPRRAEVLAATEVTRVVTAAETTARRFNVSRGVTTAPPAGIPPVLAGDGLTATWHTREDERVCPVCEPLDEQPESRWVDEFPSGPPAHPNCRCFLTYGPESSLG